MFNTDKTFIELCLEGEALLDELDDYIDQWHDSDSNLELHDFLGMNEEEYALFLRNSSYLPHIISARAKNLSIENIINAAAVNDENYILAARAPSVTEAQEIITWIQSRGY